MSQIELIDHESIRELRLARPPVNALDPGLLDAMHRALLESGHSQIRALILSGAPNVFSAGLDLPALLELDQRQLTDFWKLMIETLRWLAMSPIPVLASITGHSPAGGTVLTLFADYRIQARGDYRIGLNEVRVGLPVPGFIYRALVRLIGVHPAERMVTQGLLVSPDEALRLGLIDEVVDPEEVNTRAVTLAQAWLTLPPLAFRETRNLARRDFRSVFEDDGEAERLAQLWFDPGVQTALHECVQALKHRSAGACQARFRST
jgi:enoyl-CoA hydratase/carnithine racemase